METAPSFRLLPSLAAEDPDSPPCHKCAALCCRYYALELDPPEDEEDFDAMKWYLLHGQSWIWVQDGDWYLQVDEVCRFLGPSNECTIYDSRPQICRGYGMPENREHPEDPLCDYFAQDEKHDLEFHEPAELDRYMRKFLADQAEKRLRRSEAAKKAWARRRAAAARESKSRRAARAR
ncbi:MAG: YkgJ family cysteine cluster protein [Acidobacteria bacterium]|nr:YkgJ family cysteine cluster protein [Acidobacteriota bacterium]